MNIYGLFYFLFLSVLLFYASHLDVAAHHSTDISAVNFSGGSSASGRYMSPSDTSINPAASTGMHDFSSISSSSSIHTVDTSATKKASKWSWIWNILYFCIFLYLIFRFFLR